MPTKIDNPNMGANLKPTTSAEETRNKYSQYFVKDKNKTVVSIDTFFKLLLAEMTNQDPLEPTSNTEFVSQLASFTALQTNSDSLHYNTVSYASSLAGKTVSVDTKLVDQNKKPILITGLVTGVDMSDDKDVKITINGKSYSLKDVKNVVNSNDSSQNPSVAPASGDRGAYAVSLIGKKALVTAKSEDGANTLDEGIVESVEYKDGEYRVVVNGVSYATDNVVRVKEADSVKIPAQNTGSDGAYAVSLIGKNVLSKTTDDKGKEVYVEGIVSAVEIVDGAYGVVIDDYVFPIDSVVSVSNPKPSQGGAGETKPAETKPEQNGGETKPAENSETSLLEENEALMKLFS